MSRDEALTATLNAARALRRYGCTNELLAQLYSAIDAIDAVGDADSDAPVVLQNGQSATYTVAMEMHAPSNPTGRAEMDSWDARTAPAPCPTCDVLRAQLAERRGDRPGFCSADPTCWMLPMVPGGTCYGHSEIAKKPHPWERAALRSGIFAVGDADD